MLSLKTIGRRIPKPPHEYPFLAEAYGSYDFTRHSRKKLQANALPSGIKEIHKDPANKKNLIISIVENNPEILANILNALDQIFRLETENCALDYFPNTNVYCNWATSCDDHNQVFDELIAEIPQDHQIQTLAVLDGNLNYDMGQNSAAPFKFGPDVYRYLLEQKNSDPRFKKLFAMFQSSRPDWVEKLIEALDKEVSFNSKFTEEELDEIDNLFFTHGLNLHHISRKRTPIIRVKKELEDLNFWEKIDKGSLLENLRSIFSRGSSQTDVDELDELISHLGHEEVERGYNAQNSTETGVTETSKRLSIFKEPDDFMDSAEIRLSKIKECFRSLVEKIAEHSEELRNFSSDRPPILTSKIKGNEEFTLRSLLEAISQVK